MYSLTAAKFLLEQGAVLLPGMLFLCAGRCGGAAAAGDEGGGLQRRPN